MIFNPKARAGLAAGILAATACAPAVAQSPAPPSGSAPASDIGRLGPAIGALAQADGPGARARLEALTGLSEATEDLRRCILQRLDAAADLPAPPADAAFTDRVLHVYRLYWRQALAAPGTRDAARDRLGVRLAEVLGRPDMPTTEIEAAVRAGVEAEARHVLAGQTGLLRDLMIWSGQEARDYEVELPEGPHTSRVFLLTDFQNGGWLRWATCEKAGTGGWARPEGLYAVVSGYGDLTGEDFRVSFLGHETQHFADYEAWPGLPGRELEYRAKLTELSLADVTLESLLTAFARSQSDNEADAHSHANKRVLAALRTRLGLTDDGDLTAVPRDVLREAARQELLADSARRRAAAGAAVSN